MRKELSEVELKKRIVDEKDEDLLFETVADINLKISLIEMDLRRQKKRLQQVMETFEER